jgi:hexosaminidase
VRGIVIAAATLVLLGAAAGGAEARPATVPALREWTSAPGTYAFARGARIVLSARDRGRLRTDARVLADDLRALTRRRPRIVTARRTRRGDISLRLGSRDARLGGEGYAIAVGRTVRISARTSAGAFYGTRTLLQLMRVSRVVPGGRGRDWPRYPERGLMVDNGRQFFTRAWLERRVRELAYLKLNRLHLHFTDNEGWRIESERHPEIVSARRLSKADVRRVIALARRHHVRVVPEIDMPGHLEQALAKHPSLQLVNALGQRAGDKLDITSEAGRRFARELIEEYLALFPGPEWHLGGDEYLVTALPPMPGYALYPVLARHARARFGEGACAADAVLDFFNWANRLVRSHGRRLRVWNDYLGGGCRTRLDRNVAVDWWTNHTGVLPQALVAAGHRVLNGGWFPTYYVSAEPSALSLVLPPKADMRATYERWEPHSFHGPLTYGGGAFTLGPAAVLSPGEPLNTGVELHVWNDLPQGETEDEIAAGIAPRLRVIAQKTWGSPRLTEAYADFLPLAAATGGPPG